MSTSSVGVSRPARRRRIRQALRRTRCSHPPTAAGSRSDPIFTSAMTTRLLHGVECLLAAAEKADRHRVQRGPVPLQQAGHRLDLAGRARVTSAASLTDAVLHAQG